MNSLNFKVDNTIYSVREIGGGRVRASRTRNGKRLGGRPRTFSLDEIQDRLRFKNEGRTYYVRKVTGDSVQAGVISNGKRRGGRSISFDLQEVL